jgi:hypothetical protein
MIKFNRRQMNAIASLFDKIATASAVGTALLVLLVIGI